MDFGQIGGSLGGFVEFIKFIVDVTKKEAALADTGIADHNDFSHGSFISHYDILYIRK